MKASTVEKLGTVQSSLVLEPRTGAARINHWGKSRDEAGDLPADGERHNEAASKTFYKHNLILMREWGVRRYLDLMSTKTHSSAGQELSVFGRNTGFYFIIRGRRVGTRYRL